MGLCQIKCCLILFVFSLLLGTLSAATFISDGVFGSSVLGERRLLQAKKPCPVNFEFQNYTVFTTKCRGPKYEADLCCGALKEFGCPFAEYLNDLSNDCASTMFSYINLNGRYPPGLFASECREGKDGLSCPALAPGSLQSEKASTNSGNGMMPLMMLTVASLVFSMMFV